ncbi:MAG TPA: vWA domain-containing protein [Longimicrobium sp.]|nr:vWA domain-containing protein [Longimicrobium sp.]
MARTARMLRLTSPLAALALLATGACEQGGSDQYGTVTDTLSSFFEPVDTTPYVADVEEGLGVAVAILLDNSGSMADRAEGDVRPKYVVARRAVEEVLRQTAEHMRARPDQPVSVGIWSFSGRADEVLPMEPYDSARVAAALARLPAPAGGTAIGDAMDQARAALYRSGRIRKHLLVVTDGENNEGAPPDRVAREIRARSQGAVQMYFVAFDIDPEKFRFATDYGATLASAGDGAQLRSTLEGIYAGKILAEAADTGEGAPPAGPDTATTTERSEP